MTTTLSESDKERVRYHLGYMGTSSAPSIQYGFARPVQTMFLVEQALTLLVNPLAVERCRCILDILDGTERRMVGAQAQLGVASIGGLTMRGPEVGMSHPDLLEREYVRWAGRLADLLGAPRYAFSARFTTNGPGMISRG